MDDILKDFDSGLDIVSSMERLRDNPSSEEKLRFFSELKAVLFLVPCREQDNSIAALNTQEEEKFLPAFTSAQELAKWQFPLEKVSVLPLDALKHIVIDSPSQLSGIAINPFGKVLLLRHPELAEMDSQTEGMTLKRTDHTGKLKLKATSNYPVGLPKALSGLFRTHPEVYRAWLVLAQGEREPAPHKLFVIDFDGDRTKLFPLVAKTVQPFMRPGESFELMKADLNLIQAALEQAQPMYIKR